MVTSLLGVVLALVLGVLARAAAPVAHVDGFIGTTYFQDSDELGQTIPQVGVPFAHSPFTPDTTTVEEHCVAPYYYHDEYWKGMRKTHWTSGSCVLDYGSMTIIPSLTLDVNAAMTFHLQNHSAEKWSPAHYEVDLVESGIGVEASNDNRAGVIKFDTNNVKDDFSSIYIIVMSFDTHYNQSSLTASPSGVKLSNPVHRYYQGSGHSAGFSGHHSVLYQQEAKSYGIIKGYSEVIYGNGGESLEGRSDHRGPVAAFYEFDRKLYSEVVLAAGSSFVSRDKAEENILAELCNYNTADGDEIQMNARQDCLYDIGKIQQRVTGKWNAVLSTVQVSDHTERSDYDPVTDASALTKFYTAMWHSLLLPRVAADHDGGYMSFAGGQEIVNGRPGSAGGYWYYDDFSMWDTYRATVPFQFLVVPEIAVDMAHSLVKKSEQGGWLPMFPVWNSYTQEMIGDHCAVLLADAFQKGLLDDDSSNLVERSYLAMRRNALEIPSAKEYLMGKGRRAIKEYLELGFVPLEATMPLTFHDKEQVSRTLEYAYNDYVVAQMALKLGYHSDYEILMRNSESYKMVIDTDVGFPRGRYMNLSWDLDDNDFDPNVSYEWLTEATAYQYAWYVPHQVEKLIDIYNGDEEFADKLNVFFDEGHYNHGNEPDHQAVFLYAYLQNVPGEGAWRIQDRVRGITLSFYTDGPGGLAGNDDAGQISSWFVLSAMGLYQVCPGCGGSSEYVLTTPLFDSTTLTLGDASFHISAQKNCAEDIYIQAAQLNGQNYDCAFLSHDAIIRGGSLTFQLGSSPNKTWGSFGRECLKRFVF